MRGALIEARDNNGETPLRWAIRRGKADSAKELIKFGASLQLANDAIYKQDSFLDSQNSTKMQEAIKEGERLRDMMPEPGRIDGTKQVFIFQHCSYHKFCLQINRSEFQL